MSISGGRQLTYSGQGLYVPNDLIAAWCRSMSPVKTSLGAPTGPLASLHCGEVGGEIQGVFRQHRLSLIAEEGLLSPCIQPCQVQVGPLSLGLSSFLSMI